MSVVKGSHIYIGCAGWSVPKEYAATFPAGGSHLQRYARRLLAVEINSSFYRPHRPATYARWAAAVPDDFRFAVKVPREITHHRRLADVGGSLERFLNEVRELKTKLGPLLIQLPPRLPFNAATAGKFFDVLRVRFAGDVVCEPRHATWFSPAAEALLAKFRVARVAADPAINAAAAEPGAWVGLTYYRMHGSPKMYYSAYTPEYLGRLIDRLVRHAHTGPVWCIFDNTALGHATANALDISKQVAGKRGVDERPAIRQ